MHFVTPQIYSLNRPFVDINYGDIVVHPNQETVEISINDLYGNPVFHKEIFFNKDLKFNKFNLLKNPLLCKAI